jgi:hypothetical protein
MGIKNKNHGLVVLETGIGKKTVKNTEEYRCVSGSKEIQFSNISTLQPSTMEQS